MSFRQMQPKQGVVEQPPVLRQTPGCAICEKPLLNESNNYRLYSDQNPNVVDNSNQILATNCGHLYHLRCLEGALIHEKVTLADRNLPNRRTCPNLTCMKDLSKTQLTKIQMNGVPLNPQSAAQNADLENAILAEMKRLHTENARLRNELQALRDKDMTRVGEKVFLQNPNGTYARATVVELMVKVQKDTEDIRQDQPQPSRQGSFRERFSVLMKDTVVPLNKIILSKHFNKLTTGDDMKTRWSAGEKIFLLSEQKQATIKWIGSRDKTFMALLEYDDRISNEILSDEGLPCKPKPYHCKMVYLNELNVLAEKVREQAVKSPVSRFFRFTPARRSAHP